MKGSLVLAGDGPGVGGGVISGTRGAECTPKTWSATVRAEGRNMVRHDDAWWMNHKNTYGRLAYTKDPNTYDTPEAKAVEPRMRLAFYQAPGTATDAPSLGTAAQAPASEPAPTVSQDMGELLKGGAKISPFAAEMGLIGGLPAVMKGSMQRLNAAASADAQKHRDDLARQQGYKDEDDLLSALRKIQADEKARAEAVRVSGKAKKGPCPCLVGKYIVIQPSCKAPADRLRKLIISFRTSISGTERVILETESRHQPGLLLTHRLMRGRRSASQAMPPLKARNKTQHTKMIRRSSG